jgi:flagellar basal-body rod protein FlgC
MIQFMTGADSAAAALNAEKARMEVISQNIANASITHGSDGKPFQRQRVVFDTVLKRQMDGSFQEQIEVGKIEKDNRPPRLVHQPGHPDADANGMVAYPDINIHEEMVDMIAASRAFEANLAVVRNARQMALQTMQIGKH